MKQKRTYVTLLLVVAMLVLGIAYAALDAIQLPVTANVVTTADTGDVEVVITSGTPSGDGTATLTPAQDGKSATLEVSGLTKVGDTAVMTITFTNERDDVKATLSKLTFTNPNTKWFNVTSEVTQANMDKAGTATATITVELKETVSTTDDQVEAKITGLEIGFEASAANM